MPIPAQFNEFHVRRKRHAADASIGRRRRQVDAMKRILLDVLPKGDGKLFAERRSNDDVARVAHGTAQLLLHVAQFERVHAQDERIDDAIRRCHGNRTNFDPNVLNGRLRRVDGDGVLFVAQDVQVNVVLTRDVDPMRRRLDDPRVGDVDARAGLTRARDEFVDATKFDVERGGDRSPVGIVDGETTSERMSRPVFRRPVSEEREKNEG